MNEKILIGSIFAAILMLSMPVISNIQAQPTPATTPTEDNEGCSICPLPFIDCTELDEAFEDLDQWEQAARNGEIKGPLGGELPGFAKAVILLQILFLRGILDILYWISGCLSDV